MLPVEDVAVRLNVSADHVCDLIRAGALAAHNLSLKARPLYRVPEDAITDFLARTRTQNSAAAGACDTAAA